MHPALVTAVVAAQRHDQITRAAATRRARQARQARRAARAASAGLARRSARADRPGTGAAPRTVPPCSDLISAKS